MYPRGPVDRAMPILRYLILLITLLVLSSCGGRKAVPMGSVAAPRSAQSSARIVAETEPIPARMLSSAVEALRANNNDSALVLLQKLMEQYPKTSWYKRALFLAERACIQMDQSDAADAAMLRVQADYPELADYALFLLAEYHVSKERYTRAAAFYQRIIEMYPKSSLTERSAFGRAQALLESAAYLQAGEAFDKFLKDYPRSDLAPAAGLGLGKALLAQARLDEAVQVYQEVWVEYPGDPNDQAVELALAELSAKGAKIPELSPEDLYERGKNLYRSNQYEKTIAAFVKLLERSPKSAYRTDALLVTGIAAFKIGKRTEAASVLEQMVKDNAGDPRVPEALYWIGKSYSKLGEWDKGVNAFRKLLDRFPESEWADDALFLTGNIYREAGDMKKALAYYGRLAEEYPESKFADSAIWWQAWTNYTAGDYEKTEQTLQKLVNRYPRSFLVNQARYWQGRAMEKRKDFSRAVAYYERVLKKGPYTYYGSRAAGRLASLDGANTIVKAEIPVDSIFSCKEGECSDDPLQSFDTDDGPPVWTEETRALLAAQPSFKKTFELMYLDMKKEAALELWSLKERMPRKRGALIGLSKAFFELGDYNRSLILVLRNYERYLEAPLDKTPEDLWLLAYPQAYWDSIQTYAKKYKQDPYFVAAIIREESQFNTEAQSPVGARGLMQVMPSTGAQVAKQIKAPGFDRDKLFDSDTSIMIGTWYIGRLMKRFKGDPLFVAAAYNAGPEAVAQWLKQNGNSKDREAFVESIPYMETRGYVKKVMRNYAEYKRIYGRTADIAPLSKVDTLGAAVTDEPIKNP
jgi:soluble lytic murein transglycosylase